MLALLLTLPRRTIKALTADGRVSVESVILKDGEEFKSMEELGKVWDKALSSRLDRGCTFLALGGGVVGDMTGFAAACYQRGVHFIQVRCWPVRTTQFTQFTALPLRTHAHLHSQQPLTSSERLL